MLDIKFIRENPEAVKENIKKKFQDAKLPLVDEVLALDEENRAAALACIRRETAGKIVLLVTHEETDARTLGARVIRL